MHEPAKVTLAKYGLTLAEWVAMYTSQKGLCAVCLKDPKRLVIDHKHQPGWKHMAPKERKLYVRGLCCDSCNHYVLTRYADAAKHRQAAAYLDKFERRLKRANSH